jgi:hypothetical protein
MTLHNDNTNNEEKQQSNYEIAKEIGHIIWKIEVTPLAIRLLLYQVDQQFNYIKNGKIKEYDSVSLNVIARQFGMANYQNIVVAIKELESCNILIVDREIGRRNKYFINRNIKEWII